METTPAGTLFSSGASGSREQSQNAANQTYGRETWKILAPGPDGHSGARSIHGQGAGDREGSDSGWRRRTPRERDRHTHRHTDTDTHTHTHTHTERERERGYRVGVGCSLRVHPEHSAVLDIEAGRLQRDREGQREAEGSERGREGQREAERGRKRQRETSSQLSKSTPMLETSLPAVPEMSPTDNHESYCAVGEYAQK